MPVSRWIRHALFLLAVPVAGMAAAHAEAARTPAQAAEMLERADQVKHADFDGFTHLLQDAAPMRAQMDAATATKLAFLEGWRATWVGDFDKGRGLLESVADTSPDAVLRVRALATLINLFGVSHRYEDAFRRLNQMQELLPSIRDARARFAALGEASQLLSSAGQFDAAEAYAKQMVDQPPEDETECKGMQHLLRARSEANRLVSIDPEYQRAIVSCDKAGDTVFADTMRADIGSFYLRHGQPRAAIDLLEPHRDDLRDTSYATLLAEFDASLASAYLAMDDLANARRYALSAVAGSVRDEFTDPKRTGFKVLYEVEQRLGNAQAALNYHEQYMAADKAYLDDISARSLAFQIVDQQVVARKAEVDALNKKNEILRLSNALDKKEVETGRLYIFVLGLCLVGIVALVLRLRRSQLRFMRMARRDGLTGICNREHFVEQSERVLAYGARSDRGACLILFDLDHFKNVNDTWGHSVGDEVLKRAVDVCRRALHACDVFGRLGGEEFAVLLPDCSPAQARARAEQLRLSISATSATPSRPELLVTASFGVASTLQCGFELHRLLVVADGALYRAKRSGRNCVFMGDSGDIPDSPYPVAASG
ncbi:GGDEF domain-containing protein [Luteibacter aegosomatissinici]|uniref:GGDEF domain-containing protein n=1 Tax=Luteibacter aegosomatissinici TaxID=2911539 RepID=UPI001FF92821|nr:GGDEF domain-containing protein [Luteibacter aegosomatissinici]UPG92968.1 diguanylate cyclase [Luteibacter aegosomatissinici]